MQADQALLRPTSATRRAHMTPDTTDRAITMYQHSAAETAQATANGRFVPGLRLPRATAAVALFADVVGYTEHCERLDPEEVFLLLCEFYRHAGRAITAEGADFVDHFGDEVLAVWKHEAPLGIQALKALRCSFALHAEIAQWNDWRQRNGLEPVKVGVGIHAGPVMLGRPLGGYGGGASVFGDTVNIASRLERQTRAIGADIVISDRLYRLIQAMNPRERLLERFAATREVTLNGRAEPLAIRHATAKLELA